MKQILHILIALCIANVVLAQQATPAATPPQPLIRVYESKLFDPTDPNKNLLGADGIAEINGTLTMKLDRDAIRSQMLGFAGVKPADISLLSKYKTLLLQKVKTQQLLQEGLESADGAPDFQKLQTLSILLDDFYSSLLDDPELKALAAKALVEYKQKVAAGTIDKRKYPIDMYFYDYFGQTASDLVQKLEDADHIKFILAGKMRNANGKPQPVHIGDDFDDIPEQTYVAPRWVFSLSEDQKQELRDISNISDKLNKMRNSAHKQSHDAILKSFSSSACIDDIKTTIDSLPSLALGFTDTMSNYVMATIKPIQDQLITIQNLYLGLPNTAAGVTGSEQLIGFNDKIVTLKTTTQAFFKDLPKTLDNLPNVAKATPQVQQILALKDSCYARFMRDFNQVNSIYEALKSAFGGGDAEARFNNAISDQVKRLSFNDIPQETTIDLTQTGNRKNGDQLILQAFLQMNNAGADLKPQQIFRQEITLQQIAMYSEVKVNMILANPEPDLKEQKHKFAFAPSYSVLFHWGSRKSKFYNEYINIGVGLNFSSPDFDYDGVPEFAASVAVSVFKDFLSVGYGYDFGVDSKFFFIGCRIPFASAALPILNSVDK
ncbi:MAG: hypothetical protein WCR52_03170 [Bacteroidota bacterium]